VKKTPGDPELDPNDFWIFGYASLMWRPGFAFTDAQPATLPGFVRDMCFTSIHYRGTPETPGLVCGLMPSEAGLCKGRAYRLAPTDIDTAVNYLDSRELITGIYLPRHLALALADGRTVTARVYVADTSHAQFAGGWSDDEKAAAIVNGRGSEGRSLDYLSSLVGHLRELKIDDAHIAALLEKAKDLEARA
jgi:cation transport protein ChaC